MAYELNEQLKNEILTLLEQGRRTDPECQRFGAEKHQYKLNPVISEAEVDEILESRHFRLPEDYYWFLTHVGNGGAGPFYGLYEFSKENKYGLAHLPVNYVTQEECDAINEDDVSDDDYDAFYDRAFGGMIAIDHEGCSGVIRLIVQGEDFGKIIETDYEFFGAPRFPSAIHPNTFMDWYMGWLHEIALGYTVRGGYGNVINGSVEKIYQMFLEETDDDKRERLLYAMEKGKGIEVSQFMQPSAVDVLKLPKEIVMGLKKTALEDDCTEVATAAAHVIMHYGCEGWRDVVRYRLNHYSLETNDALISELNSCCEHQFKFTSEVDEWYETLLPLILQSVKNNEAANQDGAYRYLLDLVMHSSKYRFEDVKELLENEKWEIMEPVLEKCSRLPISQEKEPFYFEFTRSHIKGFLQHKEHDRTDCAHLDTALCLTRDVPKHGSEGCGQRFYDYIKEDLKALRQYFQAHSLKEINPYIASICERVYEWLDKKEEIGEEKASLN